MFIWDEYGPVGCLVVLIVVAFLAFVGFGAYNDMATENECNALGWPSHNVTITFHKYCIARTNQTDIIVPLDSARKLGRRVTP